MTDFTEGKVILFAVPFILSPVLASTSCPFLTSGRRWKCAKKSDPMIGVVTSATMNRHRNVRRSPKSGWITRCPYVLMLDPLAAKSSFLSVERWPRTMGRG